MVVEPLEVVVELTPDDNPHKRNITYACVPFAYMVVFMSVCLFICQSSLQATWLAGVLSGWLSDTGSVGG